MSAYFSLETSFTHALHWLFQETGQRKTWRRVRLRFRKPEGLCLLQVKVAAWTFFIPQAPECALSFWGDGMRWGLKDVLGGLSLQDGSLHETIWGQGKCYTTFFAKRSVKETKLLFLKASYSSFQRKNSSVESSGKTCIFLQLQWPTYMNIGTAVKKKRYFCSL